MESREITRSDQTAPSLKKGLEMLYFGTLLHCIDLTLFALNRITVTTGILNRNNLYT
jgi:hypothetical protein